MRLALKWLCLVFLVASGIPIYFISTMRKGNFLAGPVSVWLFCVPLAILQFIFLVVVWKNDGKKKRNTVLTLISFLAMLFEFYLLYSYATDVS